MAQTDYKCPQCGGKDLTATSYDLWNPDKREWIDGDHSYYTCQTCGYENQDLSRFSESEGLS